LHYKTYNKKDSICLPDYRGGSIVNLMGSISRAFGHSAMYRPLKLLPPGELSAKNIILMVIDGLGYEFLNRNGKKGFLWKNNRGVITSVFPPTTAAAITSFRTGLAPQQHALTGWFMYMKELGVVAMPLPFTSRSGVSLGIADPSMIFRRKSFFDMIKAQSYEIMPEDIIDSDYTIAMSGRAKRVSYTSLPGFFRSIRKAIRSNSRRKYIYSYWPVLDTMCHVFGTRHKKPKQHLAELQRRIESFARSIKGTDSIVIITGDHGLMETNREKAIWLEKHPALKDTLTLPLCGEPRAVYCYVRPSKVKEFKAYINRHFKDKCWLYKSEDLIKKNYFGLLKADRSLQDRVGDYVLLMKDNYILKDRILGEDRHFHKGNHGGVSRDEICVPLIVFKR